jgi:hypothetical protein
MKENTTVLITGANRGVTIFPSPRILIEKFADASPWLGESLLAQFLARPNVTAIPGVRNPEGANVKALKDLPRGNGSELIIVKIDSMSETDAETAIYTIKSK